MIATTVVNLNFRTEPSHDGVILSVIQLNRVVTVLETGILWSKVRYQNAIGYCATRYLDFRTNRIVALEQKTHELELQVDALVKRLDAIDNDVEPEIPDIVPSETRVASAFSLLNHRIETHDSDEWFIKDVFYTLEGNWEVGEQDSPYAIEQWARTEYLKPFGHPRYFDDAGANNHILALARDVDGTYLDDVLFTQKWPTGSDTNSATLAMKKSGWVNWIIGRNVYYPDQGHEGPFSVTIKGQLAPVLHGIGLPYGLHVSTFVVFQKKVEFTF